MKMLLLMALLMPITCMAIDNSTYWQMQQNLQQQRIINEMQNMRREQERANRQAEMQYWNQQNQQRQQNIWPQYPIYSIQPIQPFRR